MRATQGPSARCTVAAAAGLLNSLRHLIETLCSGRMAAARGRKLEPLAAACPVPPPSWQAAALPFAPSLC